MNVVGSPIYETIYLGIEGETFTRSYSAVDEEAVVLTLSADDIGDGYYRVGVTPRNKGVHIWIGESSSGIPLLLEWQAVSGSEFSTQVESIVNGNSRVYPR